MACRTTHSPESCREIYGRGIISWAKSTTWWQSFQEVRYRAERATVEAASTQQAVGNLAKVKIELLSGKASSSGSCEGDALKWLE